VYLKTEKLPEFLQALPPPLGYKNMKIEKNKLDKIMQCLNIRDHLG